MAPIISLPIIPLNGEYRSTNVCFTGPVPSDENSGK